MTVDLVSLSSDSAGQTAPRRSNFVGSHEEEEES